MAAKVRLNSKGIEAVAKSAGVEAVLKEKAEAMADFIRGMGIYVDGIPGKYALPVKVKVSETDRARASVSIAHPSGLAVQAKHGALTKAAASVGLEVKGE